MRLNNEREYEVTRQKLAELRQAYQQAQERPCDDAHVKELTLESLGHLIKQLREEMMWYESRVLVREPHEPAAASMTGAGGTSAPCANQVEP